ncbi:MAG: hypothetical protein IJ262_05430 [Clostridia bacterium]|nr:hypothetical protein [Clostridia bacterium]
MARFRGKHGAEEDDKTGICNNCRKQTTKRKSKKTNIKSFFIFGILIISLFLLIICFLKNNQYAEKILFQQQKINTITNIDVSSKVDDFNSKYQKLKTIYENKNVYEAVESSNALIELKNLRDDIITDISTYQTDCVEDVHFDIASISGYYDDIINELYDWRSFVVNKNYLSDDPFERNSLSSTILLEYELRLRQNLLPLDTLESNLKNKLNDYIHTQTVISILITVLAVVCIVSLLYLLCIYSKKQEEN